MRPVTQRTPPSPASISTWPPAAARTRRSSPLHTASCALSGTSSTTTASTLTSAPAISRTATASRSNAASSAVWKASAIPSNWSPPHDRLGAPFHSKNALDLVGPRGDGRPGNSRRPDDDAEVGPQQSAHAERQVGGGGSRGQSAHGGPPAAQARLLAARQCQKDGSLVESPRPWAAVRLHCCTTRDVHCGWAADHQYRLQEKRARGRLQERRPDLVARADRRQRPPLPPRPACTRRTPPRLPHYSQSL